MRTYLRGKITLLFMTFGLLLAIPAIALADNVVNNVSVTPSTGGQKQVTVEAGKTSAAVAYRINATGGDTTDTTGATGQNCTPVVKPAQLTISGLPAGVSVKDSTGNTTLTAPHLTFTTCGVDQFVKFAVANNTTPGNYAITVADITNNGYTSGDFAETNATFTLVVTADVTVPDTTIDTGPSGTVNSSSATFTFSSNEANSTFETRLDNGAWVANGTATSKTYNSLSDASHTFDVRATDAAGNVDQSPASRSWTVQTDSTPPVITPDVSGTLGNNGWYTSNVSVSWTVVDDESSISSQSGCDDFSVTSDQQATTYTCEATSAGGTSSDSVTIKRDATAPTNVAGVLDRDADSNGWYNHAINATFDGDDATSGIASCSSDGAYSGPDGTGKTVTGSCTDDAGNSANGSSPTFNYDTTAPNVTASADRDADHNGWYNHALTVGFSGTDATSGNVSCDANVPYSGPATNAHSISGSCSDEAGNSASDTFSFKYDATAPTISGSKSPAPTSFGWNNGTVTVNYTCGDNLSGVASCGPTDTLSSEGANQSSTGNATDAAGNTASATVSPINIDKTNPLVSLVGGPAGGGSYYFGSVPNAPTCTASDALSGLDGACSVSGYSNAVGHHTVTATAKDKAANTASESHTYDVLGWTLKGFTAPVDYDVGTTKVWNTVKGGATVPLKFEVFAGTTELTDPAVVDKFIATGVTCPGANAVTDDIEITTTGGTQLRYDTTAGQFIQNWQTPKKAGSCYDVTMQTDDGTKLPAVAHFMLK